MVFDTGSLKVDRGALWRREGRALTCQVGVCPPKPASLAGLRKQPCFLDFKGFSRGHPVDLPGALACARDHRQVALTGE